MSTTTTTCATRDVPFVLFGTGGVGAALLEAIVSARSLHAERYGIRFSAVAVTDSGGSVGDPTGLSDEAIKAILTHKAAGSKLAAYAGASAKGEAQSASDFLSTIATQCATASPGCIVVDCTATDATVPALLLAGGGEGVPDVRAVTANKKPVSGPMADFTKLALGPRAASRFRYEATVGAGLPVLAALGRVVASADPVSLISGSFSGTLGYVMSGLQVTATLDGHGPDCRLNAHLSAPLSATWHHPFRRAAPFPRWSTRPRSSATRSLTRETTSAASTSHARRSSSRARWA